MTEQRVNGDSPHYYRLKINIHGFKLDDIAVSLVDTASFCKLESEKDKVQVKVTAKRLIKQNGVETTQEYSKSYDIFKSKPNIDVASMRHYVDPKNPLYLVVEFVANTDENHFVNLDDSCESLVESAAKSLLNIRNIENLKAVIENPETANIDPSLRDYFSPSLIKDLNLATRTTFTPINIKTDENNNKIVNIELSIPKSIQSASIITANDKKKPLLDENHIKIKFDGLNMSVEAITKSENMTSTFSKQFALPRGSQPDKATFKLDENRHLLLINAPYLGKS